MEVLEAIRGRRTVRRFKGAEIPESNLAVLEEALLSAPSAGNLQSRHFHFVFRKDLKQKLADAAYGQDFVREAPLAVVCCADLRIGRHYGERGISLYVLQDVAASVQNLMLAARSLGLGSAWVGALDENMISETLALPPYLRPVAIVPVGFPDEEPRPPERTKKEDAITYLR